MIDINHKYLFSFLCILQIITIACLTLHYKSSGETHNTLLLASGTFVGYTIILVGLFAGKPDFHQQTNFMYPLNYNLIIFIFYFLSLFTGYLLSTPINKRIDIFFSLIGCALFIASGALIIQEWNDDLIHSTFKTDARKLALTKGGLAIVNGIIFFCDVIFTFRD